MTFMQNTALWALVFVLFGASAYITDRKIGIKIYSKIRKWWHPPSSEPLAQVERGFIYNRSNKARWQLATIISGIQSVIVIGIRHEDPRMELVIFFVVIPSTYFGFLIGPYYERLKKLREKGFEKLDAVESGELDVGEEVRGVYEKKKKSLGAWFDGLIGSISKRLGDFLPFGKPKAQAGASASSFAPASETSVAGKTSDDEDAAAVAKAREALSALNSKR